MELQMQQQLSRGHAGAGVAATLDPRLAGCWFRFHGCESRFFELDRLLRDTEFSAGYARRHSSMHDELHWLDVPERVTFKLGLMTYRCLHGQAPRYLADHVTPAIEVASRHRLRSANGHRLIVPRCSVDSTRTAVGLFRSLVRRSGTHCSQMNSEIRRVMSTTPNSSLKQSCSAFTSATIAHIRG